MMRRLRAALRVWWHSYVIADKEESARLDRADINQRLKEGRLP